MGDTWRETKGRLLHLVYVISYSQTKNAFEWCVYMHVCTHTHSYTHLHTDTCIHILTKHTYIHTYTHIQPIHTYTHAHTHTKNETHTHYFSYLPHRFQNYFAAIYFNHHTVQSLVLMQINWQTFISFTYALKSLARFGDILTLNLNKYNFLP